MKQIIYDTECGCVKFHVGNWPIYMGYTKKEAFKKFRQDYGLVGKHIKFIHVDELMSLNECIYKLAQLQA